MEGRELGQPRGAASAVEQMQSLTSIQPGLPMHPSNLGNNNVPTFMSVPCPLSRQTKKLLWALNLFFSICHLGLAILAASAGSFGHHIAVYRTKLVPVVESIGNREFETYRLVPGIPVHVTDLYLTTAIMIQFTITSFFHFANAYLWRGSYESALEYCYCPSRWAEYSLSASTMILVISGLSGQHMLVPLMLLFGVTFITMQFGYSVELVNRPLNSRTWQEPQLWKRLIVHAFGWTPQLFVWTAVLIEFSWHVTDSDSADAVAKRQIPGFVYAIVLGELVLFVCFALVQIRVLLNPPSEFVRGEIMYQILSFSAKSFLGLSAFFGVLLADSVDQLYVDPTV
uniref:Uncharacterized protein n=1 Tax=Chrysotila carterae TaxID=13221 RepID=A0A7S4F8B6_CHRCT